MFGASVFVACGDERNDDDSEIVVGALLDLTGDWRTLGQASEAALEIAAEQINESFAEANEDTRVRVIVEETGLDPDTAVDKIEDLAEEDVRVVVGPQSSSEARAVLDIATENGMLVVSQGSTASALAKPGDNLFRLPPDDRQEAAAVSALLEQDGITVLVPVSRDDLGNQGLHESVSTAFSEAGGSVSAGVVYAAGEEDFDSVVSEIREQVSAAIEEAGDGEAAVYLAAFGEVVDLFRAIGDDDVLSSVRWYGTSSVALTEPLLADEDAAAFAERVSFANPIYALDPADEATWRPLADEIEERSGQDPDAFALSAYDAIYLIVEAAQAAGGVEDTEALRAAFVETANSFNGVTGSTALNEAGDRETGPFDFWLVCEGEEWEWELGGTFVPGEGVSGEMACPGG